MAVRGLRRQISDSRAYQSPEERAEVRPVAAVRELRRYQSLPEKSPDSKKRSRDVAGKAAMNIGEEDAVQRIHQMLFELYQDHSPMDTVSGSRSTRGVDPLRAVLERGAKSTTAAERRKMALRRGQSLPIPDENSPLPNSPVAASPDRKKTKNVKNLSPLRPSNSAGAAAADGAQVDMFEFPPPTAPTLNRQSVSEYPRNRPPPVNTSIRHRRMFTPIQPLPSEPEPEPQPEPDRGSPFALPSVLNGSYQLPQEPHSHSPKPSPIRPVRPMLTRSQSHALESSSRARKNAAAFVKPEQTQRPPRPQRLRSKETVPDHPQSAAPARQMTAGIEQPQSAPSAAAAAAGHPLLKRDGSHAHTIGPGFPLLGGNGQRTPALFAEMLQAKKQKLRRLTSTDEEELVPNEPIPESELQARDAVWAELQALVKDHFLEIENSRLHREKVLGRGKWSAVYRARLDRQHSNDSPMSPRGHQVVAVKEATYDELRYLHKPPLHTVQEFSREIKVLSTLRHPNMPRLHGVVLQPRLSIVLELLDKGSLAQNVRGEGNPALQQQWAFEVSTRQKLGLVYDIASALAAMHEQRTIHRDVKGHNVLLTRDDLGGWHAKLADFGTSVVLEDGETLSDQVGTIGYIAPELYGDRGYSFPADVFSFAVVAWELFAAVAATQQQPSSADARAGGGDEHSVVLFENPLASIPPDQYAQAVEQGVRPELHEDICSALRDIIARCWAAQPEARPTMEQVVQLLKVAIADQSP